jgi:ATP-dependent helicase/nuclease subunit A
MTAAFYRLHDGRSEVLPYEHFAALAVDPQHSVVIEACAGSGKTWLLVARLVRCLLAGAAPGEVLAITFTRRAAQEMRERLLERLQSLATGDDAALAAALRELQVPPADHATAAARARTLLEQVLEAEPGPTIATFHGWFLRLLALAPLGSGVPRRLVTAERPGSLRDAGWRAFCAALLDPAHAGTRAAFERLVDRLSAHNAEALLRKALQRRLEIERFLAQGTAEARAARLRADFAVGEVEPAVALAADAAVRGHLDALEQLTRPWGNKYKEADALHGHLRDLLAAPTTVDDEGGQAFLDQMNDALLTQSGSPRALRYLVSALQKQGQSAVWDQAFSAAADAISLTRARQADRALCAQAEDALDCLALLTARYRQVKADAGEIDFDDIEAHAARLLADEDHAAAVHARLDLRYRHVLIDEVQDTSSLQWQAVQDWLAAYGEAVDDSARPSVFLVGDPKQSIYRFRRADPRVFAAAADWLQTHYGAVRLRTDHTRRNAPEIVDLLNRALPGRLSGFSAHTTENRAAGLVRLLPAADAPAAVAAPSAVRDPLTEAPSGDEAVGALLQGAAITTELKRWIGRLPVEVRQHGTRVERPAHWRDVLLLVRSRTHLAAYERALREAGIPFVSSRPGGLLDTLEAEDLQALLSFLVAPLADLHLAHALRTPLLGCTDADLIALAGMAAPSWWERLQAVDATTQPRLAGARDRLLRWRAAAAQLPVHDLLDRIFHEADALAAYAAAVPPAARERTLANLRAYLELALQIDAGRYPSLPRFLHALREFRAGTEQDAPGEGIAAIDDALRMLTIHEAKGLEAPIVVVVPGSSAASEEHLRPLVVWPLGAPAPVHVSWFGKADARGLARAEWLHEEQRQDDAEDQHLLYVALTRARQLLIVSGTTQGRGGSLHPWVEGLMQAAPGCVVPLDASQAAVDAPDAAEPVDPTSDVSATGQVIDYRPQPLPVGEVQMSTESDAQQLGRALHKLLEWAARREPPALSPAPLPAGTATALGVNAAQAARAHAAATAILQAPALQPFFDPARYRWARAELELLTPDGVQRPDRVVDLDGELWVLDFKWRVGEAERAAYREQLARYRRLLQQVYPGRQVRCALVTAEGELLVEPMEDD